MAFVLAINTWKIVYFMALHFNANPSVRQIKMKLVFYIVIRICTVVFNAEIMEWGLSKFYDTKGWS